MTRIHFWILNYKKALVASFVLFSFTQTAYFEKRLESVISYLFERTYPGSKIEGLKIYSLSSFHLDFFELKDPLLGNYKASGAQIHLKLFPLLFGRLDIRELYIENLEIIADETLAFSPQIFNKLYQNQVFGIDKALFKQVHIPLIEKDIGALFYKKQTLSFLDIYEKEGCGHYHFEISRLARFLKFKLQASSHEWPSVNLDCKAEGYIDSYLDMKLDTNVHLKTLGKSYSLDVSLTFGDEFLAKASSLTQDLDLELNCRGSELQGRFKIFDLESVLPRCNLKGQLEGDLSGSLTSLKASLSSHYLFYNRKALYPLKLTLEHETNIKSTLCGTLLESSESQCQIKAELKSSLLKAQLHSQNLELETSLDISGPLFERGSLKIQSHDISMLSGLFSELPLEGKGLFSFYKERDECELYVACENMKWGSWECQKAHINALYSQNSGHINALIEDLSTPYTEKCDLRLQGEKKQAWDLVSRLQSPQMDLSLAVELKEDASEMDIYLKEIKGHLHKNKAILAKPIAIKAKKGELSISDVDFTSGPLSFKAQLDSNHGDTRGFINLQNGSLEGLKLPYFDSKIKGHVNIGCLFDSQKTSTLSASIDHFIIENSSSFLAPMFLKVQSQISKEGGRYELKTYFSSDDHLFIQGSLPYCHNPQGGLLYQKGPTFHHLSASFDLKDLGRFIDIGTNTLGGKIKAHLDFHTQESGLLSFGRVDVSDLHTGFPMLDIYTEKGELTLHALGKMCDFELITQDLQSGQAKAIGSVDLSRQNYQALVEFEKFFVSYKKLFQTNVFGQCRVFGDLRSIKSSGSLSVDKSLYELQAKQSSSKLCYQIEKPIQDLPKRPKDPFKFDLHFDVKTHEALKIKGLGLDSEWTGQSLLHIANGLFNLIGKLELKKGDYRFNTKKFIIDEGVINFSEESPSSIIAKGRLNIPSHEIKVTLCGPLAEPKLQFSSNPMLAEHAIFSYILFNKPASELHPFQSLELAQTLMELSGDSGPFSLSKLRSSLSIDALDIRSGDGDKKDITLHIGKYIRPGFLVGLNQSSKSSDMLLELELKHGFFIKAESQAQKEGKFSLKWRKSF